MSATMDHACVECDGTGFTVVAQPSGVELATTCPACRQSGDSGVDPLLLAGVPPRERGLVASGLNPQQVRAYTVALEALGAGESVLFGGPAGRGKTGVAVCLLREAAMAGKSVAWCHVPTWLREVRDSFGERGEDQPTEAGLIGRFMDAHFIVVDDLGSEHVTSWTRTMVHALVSGRDSGEGPTAYTTNLPLFGAQSIASVYDERIATRLERCKRIGLTEGGNLRARPLAKRGDKA